MQFNSREAAAGAIVALIGGLFVLGALRLELGTAFQMGPGYFPLVLALLMVALGVAIMASGFRQGRAPATRIAVRGLIIVVAAPIAFGLVVRGLGLLPAVAAITFLSIYASRHADLKRASMLAVGLTAFCVLIFHYGLGLPIALFGNWLR